MRRADSQEGFTLIELVIVILIMAGAVTAVAIGIGSTSKAKLQSSAWTLAAATRYAYSRAVTQGVTVRMVLDFDRRTVQLQETTGRVVLNREDETGSGLHREGVEDMYKADGGVVDRAESISLDDIGRSSGVFGGGLESGDLSGFSSGDMSNPFGDMMSGIGMGRLTDPFLASMQGGGELGGAVVGNPMGYTGPRFMPIDGRRGEARELEGSARFHRVYTPHEPEPREEGQAFVYFFPGGTTEHTIIQVSDGDDEPKIYSLEIHPLNGRAEIYPFELEPEEELDELMEADE